VIARIISRRWFQRACQTVALIGINGYIGFFATLMIYQGALRSICLPVLNCHSCPLAFFTCPIGALQHFIAIGAFPVFVLGTVAIVGIMFGRMFCGLLCPFGYLQDLLYRLGSIRIEIPHYLCYVKYVVLAGLVLLLPYFLGVPAFCKICPAAVLEAGFPHALLDSEVAGKLFNQETGMFIGWFFLGKTVFLTAILLATVNMKRPFCRVLCPLGALLGLFNRFSTMKIAVNRETCSRCDRCARVCPVDISIYDNPDSAECVRCWQCIHCKDVSAGMRLLPLMARYGPQVESREPRRIKEMDKRDQYENMVLIPRSEFVMGGKKRGAMTSPKKKVMVESFYMDIYPVTNEAYSKVITDWKYDPNKSLFPAVGLSLDEIMEYCRLTGKRLPTEPEWEKAARGDKDARLYPWGDTFSAQKCHCRRFFFLLINRVTSVTTYKEGKSPYGCYDMIGNVWEWTSTTVDEEKFILKGGSCVSPSKRHLAIPSRLIAPKNTINYTYGFRCCGGGGIVS